MLLESIKLENFRQFRHESINFAEGTDGKNVTIIIGNNGTGKTTFAQAFFWCMYGETAFSDKSMLNKIEAEEMKPGQERKVQVELRLRHGSIEYTLMREQTYHKDYSNHVKGDNTIFDIARKDSTGNTSYVKKTQCDSEVKSILPKELSRYFFFDGERIEKMSKDITTQKKATDFADAVKGLLGLNAIFSAIQHFNPNSRFGVIGSYDSSYDAQSNAKIARYTQLINDRKKEIKEIDDELVTLEDEIIKAKSRKAANEEKQKQYAEGEQLLQQKEDIEKHIASIKASHNHTVKEICKDFNSNMSSFFSCSLIMRALTLLADKDFTGKDIPYINAKTIEYLLKQKVCICGTHLDEGSVPYSKIKELIEFLPPQSISSTVGDFKKEAKKRARVPQEPLYDQIKDNLAVISEQSDDFEDACTKLNNIEDKLGGRDVRESVRALQREIKQCENIISNCQNTRDRLLQKKDVLSKTAIEQIQNAEISPF